MRSKSVPFAATKRDNGDEVAEMTAGAGDLAEAAGLDSAASATVDATETATSSHEERLQCIRCIKPARGLLLLISCLWMLISAAVPGPLVLAPLLNTLRRSQYCVCIPIFQV